MCQSIQRSFIAKEVRSERIIDLKVKLASIFCFDPSIDFFCADMNFWHR
jgi:hypothetical protein